MFTKKLIFIYVFSVVFCYTIFAQNQNSYLDADLQSLQLYNQGKWTELIKFGNQTIESGTDFPLLRMRVGYAAFTLGNYSQSLKHYEVAYNEDFNNKTALYYCYLNNLYLNNTAAMRFYAGKLDEKGKNKENQKAVKISEIGLEYSYKSTDINERENAQFASLNIGVQLGYQLELKQGVAMYNQVINEPQFLSVNNNTNIDIKQKEYFAKLVFAPTARFNIIGGFHYVYTPFNDFKYNNTIVFGGLKYTSPYVHLQGLIHSANISKAQYNQYDVSLATYPLGNTNLYTISKGLFGDDSVFTQVIGAKIVKNLWLENNITFGKYNILIDNDGLYLINDIDTKKFKIGASIYTMISKKLLASLNYNFEEKQQYQTTNINFNQHSITANLKWKL